MAESGVAGIQGAWASCVGGVRGLRGVWESRSLMCSFPNILP